METTDHSRSSDVDIENQWLPFPVIVPLKTLMSQELSNLRPLSSGCSIYRVPSEIRHINKNAFIPQAVSIGPLHHGRAELKAMEEHKWRYLQHFLRITRVDLQDFIDMIKDRENRVRDCYSDSVPFSSDDFVKLILLDAVFIIEVLLRFFYGRDFQDEFDPIYLNFRGLDNLLVKDLIMLENQIPFFIVQEIYEQAQISGFSSINELYHSFCRMICLVIESDELVNIYAPEFNHIVDLARNFFIPLELQDLDEGRGRLLNFNVPTITELHKAGVRLKVGSRKNLFDIKFKDGILEIPKLLKKGRSEVLNRNVVAYEQCHYTSNHDLLVSHYFFLLGLLVKTPEDAGLLLKYGVVAFLSTETSVVSTLIEHQSIGVNVDLNSFYFASLCENLDEYCKRSWHLWKANLKQKYFNTPWTILSVIAAVIILILTFIQTICSILSLDHSNAPIAK